MMGSYGDGWSYGWMIAMMLGWAVYVALAVWAVVALTRRSDSTDGPDTPTPRQVLDGRYAAGQITRQEYIGPRRLLEDGDGAGWSDRPASV